MEVACLVVNLMRNLAGDQGRGNFLWSLRKLREQWKQEGIEQRNERMREDDL